MGMAKDVKLFDKTEEFFAKEFVTIALWSKSRKRGRGQW